MGYFFFIKWINPKAIFSRKWFNKISFSTFIDHALYNSLHQLIHSNHFTGTQQSTSPLVGFYSLSAFLVMNGGSLKFKDFRFSKRVGLPPLKSFHSLISPPGSVSILSFPQTKHKQQCSVTWSLHFASCMLPTISFTLVRNCEFWSSLCVSGTSLKSGHPWYFGCAELLPKTKCFLTSALLYVFKKTKQNKKNKHKKNKTGCCILPVLFVNSAHLCT